ncbi:MAG TPA: hypothetical protein VJU84_17875 [Pyrinomonadaceae bacterium]|nr:hypothetical protein [Pyrinomonadaceae bacterium]
MKRFTSAGLAFFLLPFAALHLLNCSSVAAQEVQQSQSSDTRQAATAKPPASTQSPGSDTAQATTKPVASAEAPNSTSTDAAVRPAAVRIPDGTPIEVEAPYMYRSMDFKPNDRISFRVVNPVKIDGVTLVEQGANATGKIERAKRGGHWGKAGLLVWTMQSVTAVDGSQVPVRPTSTRLRGDSKGAKVATAMIITGALMPLIAPVALLHGFKRGHDAFIPQGKRYSLVVSGDAAVRPDLASKKIEDRE